MLRAIAQSTFHPFADYKWGPATGAPSFASEPPGDALPRTPEVRRSTRFCVRDLALWLAGRHPWRQVVRAFISSPPLRYHVRLC